MFSVRVIASGTFYPPESQHPEHDKTIQSTIAFIKSNLDEKLHFMRGKNKTVVFRTWNGIRLLGNTDKISVPLLELQLQIIRNICVFLFGTQFEQKMQHRVSQLHCQVLARYVDSFIEASKYDARLQLSFVKYHVDFKRISTLLHEQIPTSEMPPDLRFVECIVWKDAQVVARIGREEEQLDYNDIFMLGLYGRVEHELDGGDVVVFDANYVNAVEPSSVIHRAAFLRVGGQIEQCSIASTRLGKNSPYIAMFVTKDAAARERRDVIMNVLGLVCVAMQEAVTEDVEPVTQNDVHGLVFYGLVDRTNGLYHEEIASSQQHSIEVTELLLRAMPSRVVQAMKAGHRMVMWNDGLFWFLYELILLNQQGDLVPTYSPSDDFWSIVREDNIHVYEALSIYLAEMCPEAIVERNKLRFTELVGAINVPQRRKLLKTASYAAHTDATKPKPGKLPRASSHSQALGTSYKSLDKPTALRKQKRDD